MRNNLFKATEVEQDGWREMNGGAGRERRMGKKILAVFVWQQPAEEPQGHANERKAFQRLVGGGGG